MKEQTNQQILEKAIQKAIDGGWWPFSPIDKRKRNSQDRWFYFVDNYNVSEDGISPRSSCSEYAYECLECYRPMYQIEIFIFNHDFAKALWGEAIQHSVDNAPVHDSDGELKGFSVIHLPNFLKHLQQMVIADDPIKYLGENI